MTKNLYCITGAAGSGKDTAGDYLAKRLGVETYALADPIKDLVSTLIHRPRDYIDNRANKEKRTYYSVTVDSLEATAKLYNELGLNKYQDFPEAWDTWLTDLHLNLTPWGEYEGWYSPRDLYQYIGTDWGRNVCDTIWLELTPEDVVVTDIRMKNEAGYFINKGYKLLEIINPNLKPIAGSGHVTESGEAAKAFSTIPVYNGGLIRDLYANIDVLLQK